MDRSGLRQRAWTWLLLTFMALLTLTAAGGSGAGVARAAPACVVPPANLAGWWSFDTIANSRTPDLAGSAYATLVNTPSLVPGMVGSALQPSFHAPGQPSNKSNYVRVADQSSIHVGTGDFSIDAWIKTSADRNSPYEIVDKRRDYPNAGNSGGAIGYELTLLQGRLHMQLATGSYSQYGVTNVPPLNDGRWHFVAVTVDRDQPDGLRMYVDDQFIGTFDPTSHQSSLDTSAPLAIGAREIDGAAPDSLFDGAIDELELTRRALSPTEISQLYQAGSAGKCRSVANPLVYFVVKDNLTSIRGTLASNRDVLVLGANGQVARFFDGTFVGLTSANDIDAFAFGIGPNGTRDGSLLFSFTKAGTIPGIAGQVTPSDIVQFVPSGPGNYTTGTFRMFMRGADVKLTTADENINALDMLMDGTLLISTTGRPDVDINPKPQNSDVIQFIPTAPSVPGNYSKGIWARYFVGKNLGMATSDDVDGVAVDRTNPQIDRVFLSSVGDLDISGSPSFSAANEDIVEVAPDWASFTRRFVYFQSLGYNGNVRDFALP